MIRTALAAAALIAAAATPASAAYVNVWSTSFDTNNEYENTGPFPWTSLSTVFGGAFFDTAGTAPGLGSQYFHNDTGGTTKFSAFGLGAHNSLKLSFDLVFADSWDSVNGAASPDYLYVDVNGTSDAYTAANASGSLDYFGPGTLTGFDYYLYNRAWPDKIVHFDFIIPHTASTFYLSLYAGGAGFQYGTDESWGIDNFALSAQAPGQTVPEPAAWAMMITGFGMTGSMLRRRRMQTAA